MTDEGGTKEDAWWNYGVGDCVDVLHRVTPENGIYLVDIDSDELLILNKETYSCLWRTHGGVEQDMGTECVYMQGQARSGYRNM